MTGLLTDISYSYLTYVATGLSTILSILLILVLKCIHSIYRKLLEQSQTKLKKMKGVHLH